MNLIADIGATQTRCAILDAAGDVQSPEVYRNSNFNSLQGLLHDYLSGCPERPDATALAVAAPVLDDEIRMPNLRWRFRQDSLRTELDMRKLIVVNDFAAVAWALPDLGDADLRQIGGGTRVERMTMATLGPGSGLGIATVAPTSGGWTVVDGEGGNMTFAGVTPGQQAVTETIRARFGHCSAENLLSGPGLANIHSALAAQQGRRADPLDPVQVTEAAAAGDTVACRAVDMFFEVLGTVAGNLALTVGARGGVFIAGGIVPQLLDPLEKSRFRECFEAKGRHSFYVEAIPTYAITAAFPAFRGLRRLLGYR